jgi:uncharacterized protein YeeX (DUF496 family)
MLLWLWFLLEEARSDCFLSISEMQGIATFITVRNVYNHLQFETVTDIIAKFACSHEKRLQDYINIEGSRQLNVNNITRQLKRKKPFELVIC